MVKLSKCVNLPEFRNCIFITTNACAHSFDLRASAIIYIKDDAEYKYLMVFNNVANKYKHPGGHVYISESLLDALKRELQEEIGLEIDVTKININNVIFDAVLKKDKNLMINALFPIPVTEKQALAVLKISPLPTKLFTLKELNLQNTWQSEINAIKKFVK